MPHMGSNARLNSTPAEMASDSIPEAAAPKPVKAKPSKQHCFTAEMDLAAAGFLQPTPAPAVATRLPHDSAVPVISVRHSSDELQPKVSSRASLQRHSLQGQPQCFQPARSHRSAHTDRQADPACSSEELSPAAKELLIATGLMSEEQDPGQIPVQGPVQLLLQHQQQNVDLVGRLVPVPTSETCATEATSRHQLAQQQDRVLNMADAVQQLDGDSICRISDACHQPAKRSRSCLPEGCQAEEAQLSSSQTVSEAQEDSGWANSHPDEVMSEHQPDLLQPEPSMKELQIHGSAPEHCGQQQQQQQQEQWQSHQHQYSQQQQHHHHPGQAAFGAAPSEELAAEPIRPAIAASPRSPQACAVPMQYDSLEITQPNLTPAPHAAPGMHVSTSSTSPNENQAPTGNLPSGSGHPAAFVPLARHDTQPRSAAPKPAALLPQQRVHYHSSNASTGQYAATAQPRMGKTNSGKWRQRAGQRDAAFAGTDEPHVITSEALLGQPQQLQQPELPSLEAVHAVGAAGNVAQPRNADGSYKYQEVVRKKAEREALQVWQIESRCDVLQKDLLCLLQLVIWSTPMHKQLHLLHVVSSHF